MKVKAAAKINLMLDVVGVLPNGYHSLYMIMQSVDCYDYVRVDRTENSGIKIITADPRVPTDEKNIAYKAAKAFFDKTGICENNGIEIEIEKHIPMAAGLAGGSADGAGVIFALDKLFDTNLSTFELCEIGEKVGADVPFSIHGGTALCTDIGSVIAPLPDLDNCYVLICKPPVDVSTLGAYKLIDEAKRLRHGDRCGMLYAMKHNDRELMYKKAMNVFEQVIEVPQRPYLKAFMKKHGAKLSLMSGSGAAIYGVFEDRESAEKCFEELKKKYDEVFLTVPCKKSVEEVFDR